MQFLPQQQQQQQLQQQQQQQQHHQMQSMQNKELHGQIIQTSAEAADAFVEKYYDLYDVQRAQLRALYGDKAVVLWNGEGYVGWSHFSEFLLTLPVSKSRVESYDAQPVLCACCLVS
jgi:Nuclear transport factor 2 (NTF2) domain